MDKKNRYCKGYTAWLAHATIGPRSNNDDWRVISPTDASGNAIVQNTKTGQTIIVGKNDPWADIFTPMDQKTNKAPAKKGSGDPNNSTHTNQKRASSSKNYGVMSVNEDDGSTWRAGSGTIGNVTRSSDNDKIMKDIQTARSATGRSKTGSDNNDIMTSIRTARTTDNRTSQYEPDIRKTTGRKRIIETDRYYPMSDGSLYNVRGNTDFTTNSEYATYTKKHPADEAESVIKSKGLSWDPSTESYRKMPKYTRESGSTVSGKPSSWDPDSSSYRDWKKKYNQSYYQSHKDYWRKYYGVKSPKALTAPSSATANMYRDEAYKQAAEARSRAQYDRTNYDRRSNAQKMLDRSAADRGPERTTFGKELFNAKSRLNDMWAEGAGSIASAGKSFLKNWTSGASSISGGAKNSRASFNDMWANGASTIAKAGKSFLDAWKSGLKR